MQKRVRRKMETVMGAIRARPEGATTPELIDILYGDREDGGPIGARQQVWELIARMREHGYRIQRGGKVRGYREEAA